MWRKKNPWLIFQILFSFFLDKHRKVTPTMFQLSRQILKRQYFRYLDLDDIIEESSIETDDGGEEEEEDSDG